MPIANDDDDEFGEAETLDDEDLIWLASQTEHNALSHSLQADQSAPKRRRLNPPNTSVSQSLGGTSIRRAASHSSSDDDDAFDRPIHPIRTTREVGSQNVSSQNDIIVLSSNTSQTQRPQRLAAPRTGLQQTTLTGHRYQETEHESQTNKRRNWPAARVDEPPTHHKLNQDAMKTWVYPTNLGAIRDYQFSIVQKGLYHNTLVALPTGLGKTFIAATIMLNWFRWTKDSQIVFVAPTKPLVAQQIDACFGIVGIPQSQTSMLTGGVSPALRAEEWSNKRVFFMTPQTLINDLSRGIADPKRIVLLVVDEAHRATGGYAYVEVVKFIRRFNPSFRVLALTATPGATVEAVQNVIDGLDISRVEIRTEESLDIREYVHSRSIENVVFEPSDEMNQMQELLSRTLQPILNKLNEANAFWGRDPMRLTAFGLTQARGMWMNSEAGRRANMGYRGMMNTIFALLASLAHSITLLNYHGIAPFYYNLVNFRDGGAPSEGPSETVWQKAKGNKWRKQVTESPHFQRLLGLARDWVSKSDFVGHPKLEYLCQVVLNHFMDAGEGRDAGDGGPRRATRVMVFVQYRDSAEEIVRVLRRNEPLIKPHVFVGQAGAKGSDGMTQKTQLAVVEKFKSGTYNTLVATCIGEEGLDIGEVDLIVCYDSSASPIRMLQRMGRTGRKRAGNIVLLLMRGKEEDSFAKAKDNYEKMQGMIASGTRFYFHDDKSPRILPRSAQPTVDKKMIDIPIENSQAALPVPKKRVKVKAPPKKFHMPEGVQTGFVTASRISGGARRGLGDEDEEGEIEDTRPIGDREPEPIPPLEEILLSGAEEKALFQKFRTTSDLQDGEERICPVRLDTFPVRQRRLGQTKYIAHGSLSRRVVQMLNAIHDTDEEAVDRFKKHLHPSDVVNATSSTKSPTSNSHPLSQPELITSSADEGDSPISQRARPSRLPVPKSRQSRRSRALVQSHHSSLAPLSSSQGKLDGSGIIDDYEEEDDGIASTSQSRREADDMDNFVVDDDSEDHSASDESSLLDLTLRKKRPRASSFNTKSRDGEEDGDLPELSALVGNGKGRPVAEHINLTSSASSSLPSSPALAAPTTHRRRKRAVLHDSDDDDDDDDDDHDE